MSHLGIWAWNPLGRQTSWPSGSSRGSFHSFNNEEQSATKSHKYGELSTHIWIKMMMHYSRNWRWTMLSYLTQLGGQPPAQILPKSASVSSIGCLVHCQRESPLNISGWGKYDSQKLRKRSHFLGFWLQSPLTIS